MKSPSIKTLFLSATLVLFTGLLIPLWARSGAPQTNNRPILSSREAHALPLTAETSEELRTLALNLAQGADQWEAKAKEHEAMMEAHRKAATPAASGTAEGARTIDHCQLQAEAERVMARAFREMAAASDEMSGQESKK